MQSSIDKETGSVISDESFKEEPLVLCAKLHAGVLVRFLPTLFLVGCAEMLHCNYQFYKRLRFCLAGS